MTEKTDEALQIAPEHLQNAIYVNSAAVGATFLDFYIGFGRSLGEKGKILYQGHVLMSPQTAKELLATLNDRISEYETAYGKIQSR